MNDDPRREPPDLVPARMVNEVLYCERLMYLEWAQGEFEDNFFTIEGKSVHRRTDGGTRPLPSEDDEAPRAVTSVWLSSERLGLTAKIDLVEVEGQRAVPIEYRGASDRLWRRARISQNGRSSACRRYCFASTATSATAPRSTSPVTAGACRFPLTTISLPPPLLPMSACARWPAVLCLLPW